MTKPILLILAKSKGQAHGFAYLNHLSRRWDYRYVSCLHDIEGLQDLSYTALDLWFTAYPDDQQINQYLREHNCKLIETNRL